MLYYLIHLILTFQYDNNTWTIYNTFIYKIGASMNIHLCGDFEPEIDLISPVSRPCIWGSPLQSPLWVLALAGDYWGLQTPQTV